VAESRSDGTRDIQRLRRYTNALTEGYNAGNFPFPFFAVNMDTWYYMVAWADPNHVTLGALVLADAPLTAAQGVAAFIARQVVAFLDAFAGVFRPVWVQVGYHEPRSNNTIFHAFHFAGPQSPEEGAAIQTALEASADAYESLVTLRIAYDMRATVRDEHGQFTEIWLPDAGEASYHAHHTAGSLSQYLAHYGARSLSLLAPSAQERIAQWSAKLECNFISLLRESNADMLGRVRTRWQRWLQTHPIDAESDDELEDEHENESYVITLAVPPPATPPDNWDLAERNLPRVRAAVARWEQRLGTPFEWVVTW
jgi:hypothetical protein